MARTSHGPDLPGSKRPPRRRGPPSRERDRNLWKDRVVKDHEDEKPEKDTKEERSRKIKREIGSFVFDFIGALIVLLLLIGSLYTYTGNWPPLVVVQSGSMQHSDTRSSVGVIDTGDLVFVKEIGERDRVIPYVQGEQEGHRTYGSYGDVIIFRPNGDEDETAIIHRCVVYLEFNSTLYDNNTGLGGTYDIPSLGIYGSRSGQVTIDEDYEWPEPMRGAGLMIDLNEILNGFESKGDVPHSGYVTKGDDNMVIDQLPREESWMQPVKKDWIIGKAVGELPWFGIIKLRLEGNDDAPKNSMRNLYIAGAVLAASPFIIDFAIHLVTRGRDKGEGEEHVKEDDEEDIGPKRRSRSKKRRPGSLDSPPHKEKDGTRRYKR